MSKDLPYCKVACVVESHYFSYQSCVNVRDGHTISLREQCQFIVIELPKGIKNLVVLVDSIFEKKLCCTNLRS